MVNQKVKVAQIAIVPMHNRSEHTGISHRMTERQLAQSVAVQQKGFRRSHEMIVAWLYGGGSERKDRAE